MAKRERKNRTRCNKAMLDKYGANKRRIQDESKAVRERLVYACNLLFGGNQHEFAAATGVCYRHLYLTILGHLRFTVNMAAQIVARTGIRAEWLLCGTGSVLTTTEDVSESLVLPKKLQSSFRLFDAATHTSGIEFFPAERVSFDEPVVLNTAHYEAAAQAMFAAHAHSKPVGFFLGSAAFTVPVAQLLMPFFAAHYADFLVLTLEAALYDMQATHGAVPIDINSVARFAANRGIGYGEALGLVGFAANVDRQKSIVAALRDINLPTLISAEIGEIGRHTAPNIRGAEVGAAVGAAAYVDLLIYTEQVRHFFGNPGGVMVIAGDCQRGVRLFLSRLETLRLAVSDQTGFTFVLFSQPDTFLQTEIQLRGGTVIFLDKPTITTFRQLFQTCNDAYAGKLTHERRQPPDNHI